MHSPLTHTLTHIHTYIHSHRQKHNDIKTPVYSERVYWSAEGGRHKSDEYSLKLRQVSY